MNANIYKSKLGKNNSKYIFRPYTVFELPYKVIDNYGNLLDKNLSYPSGEAPPLKLAQLCYCNDFCL